MRSSVYRQVSIVMLEFWSLVRGFEESVIGKGDEEYAMEMFDRYERIWRDYVMRWNESHSSFELREEGFGEWIIEGVINVYVVTQ